MNAADLSTPGSYGIRGTPVIDLSTSTIFVVTFTRQQSGSVYDYAYTLWDIDIASGATGTNSFGIPVENGGMAPVTIGEASVPVSDIPTTETTGNLTGQLSAGLLFKGPGGGECQRYDSIQRMR